VHEHERGAGPRRQVGERGVGQAADVVQHHGARIEHRAGDRGLPRVDRDRDPLPHQALDERHHARRLLLGGRRGRVGDARFATDVDEVGAVGDERERLAQLGLERLEAHRIGERIGPRVDYAHDERAPRLDRNGALAQAQVHGQSV
jgi:hypothetical protein